MISCEKGYEVSLDTAKNVLIVQAWGVWDLEDMELAKNFKKELQEKVEKLNVKGREWSLYEDLVALHPQSKEVCRIMGDGIVFAIKHGMKKAVHFES